MTYAAVSIASIGIHTRLGDCLQRSRVSSLLLTCPWRGISTGLRIRPPNAGVALGYERLYSFDVGL